MSASVPVLVSHTEEYKDTLLPGAATEDEEAKWLSASNESDASAKFMSEKPLKALIRRYRQATAQGIRKKNRRGYAQFRRENTVS